MGLEFLLNLLSALPGTVISHILIFLSLLPAAGIVWTEWRNTRSLDLRPYALAIGGTMLVHFLSIVMATFQVVADSTLASLTAPFLYAEGLISILLLLWAFGNPIWKEQAGQILRIIVLAWLGLLALMTALWTFNALDKPVNYQIHSWQVPVWYALSALAALAGAILTWYRRDENQYSSFVPGSFLILSLGALVALLGTQVMGPLLPKGEGIGRLLTLLGYPIFAVALYNSSLKDLQSYRQELQELSQEALRQSQELLFLIEATRSIGEALDLRGMLGQVAENVAMALRADRVAILLYDKERPDLLTLVALYEVLAGYHTASRQVQVGEYPILGVALRKRQFVFGAQDDFTPLRPLLELLNIKKEGPLLIQPLSRQNRTMGLLIACNDHSGKAFSAEQERLATTIAVQIAGAVENSRLYQAVEAKAKELSTLLKVREAEVHRQDAVFESMAEGILVIDAASNVILVNAATEEIFSMEREAIVGTNVSTLLNTLSPGGELEPETLVELVEPMETVFDLDEQKIRVHASPVRTGNGIRLGVVAILQDITKEQLAEEAKREFIASISHELRTPLTAIKGYAEIMISGMAGELPGTVVQFLKVIRENTMRMASLTDNIISVSEIERGRIGLSYQDIEPLKIFEEVAERYGQRIKERDLTLLRDFSDDLPSINADPTRLRLILDNLLDNALKFTYPGGEVTLGCRPIQGSLNQSKFVSLWISDTGVGVEVDEQTLIWQRFYRADNPLSLEAGGLGIGLTIAKALVEAHGGRIWVDSVPGEGSTFTVLLPTQRFQGLTDMLNEVAPL